MLERGGHDPHVDNPERWLEAVAPWLANAFRQPAG